MSGIYITLDSHVAEVMEKMKAVARERMHEAVQEVRNTTLETLSGARHGRTYTVPGTHTTYTASAPGEAPATATASLRDSVKGIVEGSGDNLIGMVGTDQKHGPALEFGHMQSVGAGMRAGSGKVSPMSMGLRQVAARPWLRPSFEKASAKVKAIFAREWFK